MGACSQFGGGCQSLGLRLERPLAFHLWLPQAEGGRVGGEGPVCSQLALLWYLLNPFFCERARLRVRAFHGKVSLSLSLSLSLFLSGDPTVWVAISQWLPQIVLRALRPRPYPKDQRCCCRRLPVQPRSPRPCWWPMQASGLLLCWQLQLGAYSVGYFFFLLVILPFEIPKLPTDPPVREFPTVETSPSWLPPQDGSPSLTLFSLFVFYILPYFLLKRMGCLSGCLVSFASLQKLFCGSRSAFQWSFDEFVGEKVVSPSYSSTILGPPHWTWDYNESFLRIKFILPNVPLEKKKSKNANYCLAIWT